MQRVLTILIVIVCVICGGLLATVGIALRCAAWPIRASSDLFFVAADFFLPGD